MINNLNMMNRLHRMLRDNGDYYTLHDILALIDTGDMQSFVHNETWAITRILDFPRRRVVEVFMVVGTLAGMEQVAVQIEAFAREHNATRIITQGRLGFREVYKQFAGWKESSSNFHKDLD